MVIVPLGKALVCILWRKGEILKGERGKPIYWCMLFRTNFLLSVLVFFPFLSIFVLIFFLLFLLCFFFLCPEKSSVFPSFLQGTARAPL